MRLRSNTPSSHHEQGHGGNATLLQCSSYIDNMLCQRDAQFSGLLWPSAEARVECASARYP